MKKILCCLLLINFPLLAQEFLSAKSQRLADQLVRSINQKLAEIAALEIAAGAEPEDIKIDLSQTERYDSGRFGAILDARIQGKIISITPRSPAYTLGLQSGDIILEVNNSPILLSKNDWHKQLQYAEANTDLTLKVQRNNQELMLGGAFKAKYTPQWQLNSSKDLLLIGTLKPKYIPQWSLSSSSLILENNPVNVPPTSADSDLYASCGRVIVGRYLSEFSRLSGTAAISNIDGQNVSVQTLSHRLAVGEHTLKVNKRYSNSIKDIISLTVEPNITYYIGYVRNAEWEDSGVGRIDREPYSGPSIIKTKNESCSSMLSSAETKIETDYADDLVCKAVTQTGSRIRKTICRTQVDIDKENAVLWRGLGAIDKDKAPRR